METQKGSAVILILLMIVGVLLLASAALKSSMFLYDIALERQEHICMLEASKALMRYGIALAWVHYDPDKYDPDKQEEYSAAFSQWPLQRGKYEANLTISPEKERCIIRTELSHHNGILSSNQSTISIKDGKWNIEQWL